jgi:hypothetical protein
MNPAAGMGNVLKARWKQTGLANVLQQVCCNREEFIPSGIPGNLLSNCESFSATIRRRLRI